MHIPKTVPEHHAPLIRAAVDRFGSLAKLAEAISKETDFAVTVPTAWKWTHGQRGVSMEHAWAIDYLTGGEIALFDFYPIHRRTYRRSKRPRKRISAAELAMHAEAMKAAATKRRAA